MYFAIDNIDFLEDTPYGQNTLHGTIIVVNQRQNEFAEPLRGPLLIPDKPSNNVVDVNYLDGPDIKLADVKFKDYFTTSINLQDYKSRDKTWVLASYFSNDIQNNESRIAADESNDLVVINQDENDSNLDGDIPHIPQLASGSILKLSRKKSKINEDKSKVMPTWSTTNSLLLSQEKVTKTNSEPVAPLLKQPPTDYATLYVLMMAQEISAVVVGPREKTIITLDLDLFQRGLKVMQSTGHNWVLRPDELDTCFAALHALGKYIDGSGLGDLAVESNIYSLATLRQIYGGKAFKRGAEYHIINLVACYFLQFDILIDLDSAESLKQLCIHLRNSLHNRDINVNEIFDELKKLVISDISPLLDDSTREGLAKE